jgi:hypothetical protein
MRESAISALTLTSYLVGITGAEIAATVTPAAHTKERVMKTKEEIKYEINFIENEIVNRDFTYLTIDELNSWLVSLQWTLKEGEGNE